MVGTYKDVQVDRLDGSVYVVTMRKPPENRITVEFGQTLIRALRDIEQELGDDAEGAVIIRGNDGKFFCTGVDLEERERNPFSSTDGFYPLVHTLLDYPFPTICLINGHCFGGACMLTLAHDYRIMNARRGFWSMPPVNLGLHFRGMGALIRAKVAPSVARKVLLEAHRFTGKEALEDGIVDKVADPECMYDDAVKLAHSVKARAKMGVYGLLRNELVKEAAEQFQAICYVHHKPVSRQPRVKI